MNLDYQISFERFNEHLADVRIRLQAPCHAPSLSMVTWIAGSYLIREFSRHITAVHYQIGDECHRADKQNKNTFVLSHAKAGDWLDVSYEVYCRDLSVRTAFIDNQRIFGNFSSLLLLPDADKFTPATLDLHIPKAFLAQHPDCRMACGLVHQSEQTLDGLCYRFAAMPAFDYLDYPFEIGTQDGFDFQVKTTNRNILHRFFLAGRHHGHLPRLEQDLQKICQTYLNWLGDAPFADYTFLTMVTGSDYGGLEHINSTALISPRSDMPSITEPAVPSDAYQRFLGLCSHEYFHAWWVKTVKPDVMLGNPLVDEAYTPLLWVFEGFTSYLDDLMLLVSGVIDKLSYLKLLDAQINRYYQTDGRVHQSVAESSFDAWIKLYRTDENTANQGISYYNKGALVALLLDMTLLDVTDGKYRLFDVIKTCYQRSNNQPFALSTEILGDIVGQMMGVTAWQAFYTRFVIGTDELPLLEYFDKFAVQSQLTDTQKPWGLTLDETADGLKIKHIHRDSAASRAGLSYGDTIIAIDGLKATTAVLTRLIEQQTASNQALAVHAFRRDELICMHIHPAKTTHQKIALSGDGGKWLNFDTIL
ncbi:M61 family metallopeptidase [Moraxella marmotae]|uniref:M61 family metallopeptidase n=1 Tax=Moraxella marmotae TaxID=3344520 RepID=UPI0035F4853D